MPTNWVEELTAPGGESSSVDSEADAPVGEAGEGDAPDPTAIPHARRIVVLIALSGIFLLVTTCGWVLVHRLGLVDATESAPPHGGGGSSSVAAVSEGAEEPSEVSDERDCVDSDVTTLSGVVAEFQDAYYAGDVERLRGVLAESSPLREQDWEAVLATQGGSTPCVEVTDEGTDTLTVYVTVSNGDVFHQVYEVTRSGDEYRIVRIKKGTSDA